MKHCEAERLFSGVIGAEYDLLTTICPAAPEISRIVGASVGAFVPAVPSDVLEVLEIGCGTGITSLALLTSRDDIRVTALDNEPTMLDQARENLACWIDSGALKLIERDALTALRELPDASQDVVASAYAIHNFLAGYRDQVLAEIHRVLKPGGLFVNGDRYALDEIREHTRVIQEEIRGYFERISALGRIDVLEQWIVHLFSDESPDHIMRLGPALARMEELGFDEIRVEHRQAVNALVSARKGVEA